MHALQLFSQQSSTVTCVLRRAGSSQPSLIRSVRDATLTSWATLAFRFVVQHSRLNLKSHQHFNLKNNPHSRCRKYNDSPLGYLGAVSRLLYTKSSCLNVGFQSPYSSAMRASVARAQPVSRVHAIARNQLKKGMR